MFVRDTENNDNLKKSQNFVHSLDWRASTHFFWKFEVWTFSLFCRKWVNTRIHRQFSSFEPRKPLLFYWGWHRGILSWNENSSSTSTPPETKTRNPTSWTRTNRYQIIPPIPAENDWWTVIIPISPIYQYPSSLQTAPRARRITSESFSVLPKLQANLREHS